LESVKTSLPPYKRKVRAISGAVTTIMLIGVAVAASLGVAAYVMNTTNNTKGTLQTTIEEVSLVKTTGGVSWAMTIKNNGNVPITSATYTLLDTGLATAPTITISNVDPGKTGSSINTTIPAANVVLGNTYRITGSLAGGDGSSNTDTTTVKAAAA
jgi:hypothetical protein